MASQLILVRHGETEHNLAGIAQGWSDSALSERGRQQVAWLARRVRDLAPDALFSSPLGRALTTAQAIAETTGLPVRTLDGFREMNLGRWEGQRFLEVRQSDADSYRRWISESGFPCPDGESHLDVLTRVRDALQSLNGASRPVIVAHGTAIRVAATALLELPLSNSRNFAQDNAAINIFERRGDSWVLRLWNDTNHWEGGK